MAYGGGDGRVEENKEEKKTKEREGFGGGESTLINLASQVRGREFSSTEDELGRVCRGWRNGRKRGWRRELKRGREKEERS